MLRPPTLVRGFTAALITILIAASTSSAQTTGKKLGPLAKSRAARTTGFSRVIIRATDSAALDGLGSLVRGKGGSLGKRLRIIDAQVALVPNTSLESLADSSSVQEVSLDRVILASYEPTVATVGAAAVRQVLGYDGSGIGVAIIDSGVTTWHDDLAGPAGGQRVTQFVDFVNGQAAAYDDYGHGTHVAGIVGGNGFDSDGIRTGIAPGAHLIVLKVLDAKGGGHISDVIAALDYVVANKDALNIRIVNLSLATGVYESYNTDPLTLAAKRAVDAGVVVVAAAGNAGRNSKGKTQYGAIYAPGNAPWVLTVGASSHGGTVDRADDSIARFSSRGPTAVDIGAKPDLVAPGVGIEALSDPQSAFYTTKAQFLLNGTVTTSYLPYLSLSGTSMAAPVVAGTVALMLQANPDLTPNAVKAILQYTSEVHSGYDRLTQGAGFLNAGGAVHLARYLGNPANVSYPSSSGWSTQLLWGNRLVRGGVLASQANAWSTDVTWGSMTTSSGQPIEWGITTDQPGVWGMHCLDSACTTTEWAADSGLNVVWGTMCGGADCQQTWTLAGAGGSGVGGTTADETVVWGSANMTDETVVWGSNGETDETVVWGSSGESDETVVWGSSCSDPSCEPVLWD